MALDVVDESGKDRILTAMGFKFQGSVRQWNRCKDIAVLLPFRLERAYAARPHTG